MNIIEISVRVTAGDQEHLALLDYLEKHQVEYQSTPLQDSQQKDLQYFTKVVSDRINHFSNINHHSFEAKELHDALNVTLRLVPPSNFEPQDSQPGEGEEWKEKFKYWLTNNQAISKDTADRIISHIDWCIIPAIQIHPSENSTAPACSMRH